MDNELNSSSTGAASRFIDAKLAMGFASFSLTELTDKTGLSVIAAKNQLLRLKGRAVRVSPRQQYFLIVQPAHRAVGAPPVTDWLDDYFKWLGQPYYFALQSAAGIYGASPQAIQETQIITSLPRREMVIGRIRVRFFVKSGMTKSLTQPLANAHAPLTVSTPETTVFDLIRYAPSLGGIERSVETIAPLLPLIKAKLLKQMLVAEGETASAQRLGFILQELGTNSLATIVKAWLPQSLQLVPLSTHVKSAATDCPISRDWGIIHNTGNLR